MDFLFLLKKLLGAMAEPPLSILIVLVASLLVLKRWPRFSKAMLWTAVVSLMILSLPITAKLLVAALDAPKLDPQAFKHVKAIIVLGGGVRLDTAEEGDVLSSPAYERLRYGVRLARSNDVPLLATGGKVFGDVAESDIMTKLAKQDFGYNVRWNEDRARDTHENMIYSAKLLQAEGVKHVLIVTHDTHMRRSLAYCRAAGMECWSAPVSTHGRRSSSWIQQLPSASALKDSAAAIHEILGIALLQYL
jgi:uncharacterized SAM-binding protein YcdF (DUF218 family)